MTLGDAIRMTRQKAFCDDNKLDYAVIENEWLKSRTDKQ